MKLKKQKESERQREKRMKEDQDRRRLGSKENVCFENILMIRMDCRNNAYFFFRSQNWHNFFRAKRVFLFWEMCLFRVCLL